MEVIHNNVCRDSEVILSTYYYNQKQRNKPIKARSKTYYWYNKCGKTRNVTGAKRGKTYSRNQARENMAPSSGKHVLSVGKAREPNHNQT